MRMVKDTPPMAKNKIKRSLGAILDPHPSKKEENALWDYFDSHVELAASRSRELQEQGISII